jgi:hypothetical protein
MNPIFVLYYSKLIGKDFDLVASDLKNQGIYVRSCQPEEVEKVDKYIELSAHDFVKSDIANRTGLRASEIRTLNTVKSAIENGQNLIFVRSNRKRATPRGACLIKVTA